MAKPSNTSTSNNTGSATTDTDMLSIFVRKLAPIFAKLDKLDQAYILLTTGSEVVEYTKQEVDNTMEDL